MLATGATLTALLVAAPVVALLVVAFSGSGDNSTLSHLLGTVLPRYVATTALLSIAVLAVSLLIGVRCAWLTGATDFPGRRWLTPALILPLAMPAFVMAYAYTDFLDTSGPVQSMLRGVTGWGIRDYWFPDVRSTGGAGLFLGLALYPYIYLLARTAFEERSASLEEAARSLGLSRLDVWWRVTWPVARPAVAAGAVLVLMETVADFGVVSYFAVDSFTAGIYRAWQLLGDRAAAARLALVLLAIVACLVWLERRQRVRLQTAGRGSRHPAREQLTGTRAWLATITCALPVIAGFVLPAALLVSGWVEDGARIDDRLLAWTGHSLRFAIIAAAVTVPVGLLAAYVNRTGSGPVARAAIALANGGYALPGVVLGIGLLVVIGAFDRVVWGNLTGQALLAGTGFAVIYAYCVRFFAVSYQGLDSGLKRVSFAMDETARSLGLTPVGVLLRVHWPMMRRTLSVVALLVAIECLKELPATLVLRPFDSDTLAVVAFQFASDERLAQAALPSLMIVLIGLVPVLLLGRTALPDAAPRVSR